MLQEINNSIKVLRSGGIIIYPTDTIWGIGCDATNESAVKKIYNLKKREDTKSMLILVNSTDMINGYIEEVPEIAYQLLEVANKPLSVIFQGARNLAPNLVNKDGSIGIRVPNDKFCQKLITDFRKPIVSTSANFSGKPFPRNYFEIHPSLIEQADYVVNWRKSEKLLANPSSIIKLDNNGQFKIIRK